MPKLNCKTLVQFEKRKLYSNVRSNAPSQKPKGTTCGGLALEACTIGRPKGPTSRRTSSRGGLRRRPWHTHTFSAATHGHRKKIPHNKLGGTPGSAEQVSRIHRLPSRGGAIKRGGGHRRTRADALDFGCLRSLKAIGGKNLTDAWPGRQRQVTGPEA